MGFRALALGFRLSRFSVWDLKGFGFAVCGLRLGIWGYGFEVRCLGVSGMGFEICDLTSGVLGLGFGVWVFSVWGLDRIPISAPFFRFPTP